MQPDKLGLKLLVADSVHGGTLKVLSLAARLLFFVLIVPILPDGELGEYVYLSSTGLLIAMVLILGLDEELPRVVAGNLGRGSQLRGVYFGLAIASMLLLVWAGNSTADIVVVAAFALIVTTGRFVAGIVRGLDPAVYERLSNLPWIIFLTVAAAFGITDGAMLIVTMGATMALVQFYCVWNVGLLQTDPIAPGDERSYNSLLRNVRNGIPRLISNLFFFATIRSPVLVPVWFGMSVGLDQMALAIAIGEVLSQFGLIPVNRAYTRWCKSGVVSRNEFRSAVLQTIVIAIVLSSVSIAALWILATLNLLPPQTDVSLVAKALAYYSLVPGFWMLRYLPWAAGTHSTFVVVVSGIQFVICTLFIMTLSPQNWFYGLILAITCTLLSIATTVRHKFA